MRNKTLNYANRGTYTGDIIADMDVRKSYRARYHGMMGRCYNPKNVSYHNYGGRGIIVCASWRKSIRNYMRFIVTLKDYKNLSLVLDRKNNNKNYTPSNMRLCTVSENVNNTRVNRVIVYFGRAMTATEFRDRFCPAWPHQYVFYYLKQNKSPEQIASYYLTKHPQPREDIA